jgi:DNA-binding NarL/FixJ family response regulator
MNALLVDDHPLFLDGLKNLLTGVVCMWSA